MARPTQVSFRLGSIPVRIQPSFLLTTVILNLGLARDEPVRLVIWGAVVLGSVLVHELGHAGTGLAFGLRPQIDLHGLGGTTSWAPGPRLPPGRRILISLAGPFMGFVAGGLVAAAASVFGPGPQAAAQMLRAVVALRPGGPETSLSDFAYEMALYVNLGWGMVNLLPMLPLDGGNVMAQGFDALAPGKGERPARIVSVVLAAAAALTAFVYLQFWPAMLAASFVALNWRGLTDLRARAHDESMRGALEKAYAALDAKDADRVLALARPVALGSRTAPVRAEALHLLAFGFLLDGRLADADAAIAALPQGFAPHPSLLKLRGELQAGTGSGLT